MIDKFVPVFEPSFDDDDVWHVANALRSGYINEASYTKQFEDEFAKTVGRKYAVVCSNGTTALFMAIRIMEPGTIIMPNYTAIGTFTAGRLAGREINVVDVNPITGNMIPQYNINDSIIIPVDNNGIALDYELIREKNRSIIIEDASQALGSGKCGTYGDVSCFSMATTKIVCMGQGGVCVTDHPDIYRELVAMKDQGRVDKSDNYPLEGYNFKVTEMQSALGYSQLQKLQDRIERMREIYAIYEDCIGMYNPRDELLWRASIMVPYKRREGIMKKLKELKVGTQAFFKPITTYINLDTDKLPITSEYSRSGIYLPSSSNLSDETVKYVCQSVKDTVRLIQ